MSKLESSTSYQYIKVPAKDCEKDADLSEKKLEDEIPDKYGFGMRHIQLVIFFLCLMTSFIARGHLGITIVAMTIDGDLHVEAITNSTKQNTMNFDNNEINVTDFEENYTENNNAHDLYNTTLEEVKNTDGFINGTEELRTVYRAYLWSKPIQEMVLTSFFLGYCLMMFPISIVCQRWGGKVPLQISMFVNGVVSILTPWMALWGGWQAVCACRVLQGLSQAGTYPGIQTLLAKWVPSTERATMSSYVYTGSALGNIVGFQLSGLVCYAFGWPVTFWTIGLLCIFTGAILTMFAAKSPAALSSISEEEKNYIIKHCDASVTQKSRAPLKAIISSKPLWANFATHVGSGVSFVFFLTQIPTYLHYILGVDVKNSGVLTSIPYIASFFCSVSFGIISDFLTNRKIISIKNARRISNSIAQVGVAVALVGASYANSITVAVICFIICKCCEVGIHTGWMVNHIDLSPNYSGTLMAIGSTFMNIVILGLPVLVSNVVVDLTNVYQWRIMLYVVAGIAFVPNLIFVLFMSAEVQPWNDGDCTEAEVKGVKLESFKSKENEKS